jgi:hypothetical protein
MIRPVVGVGTLLRLHALAAVFEEVIKVNLEVNVDAMPDHVSTCLTTACG